MVTSLAKKPSAMNRREPATAWPMDRNYLEIVTRLDAPSLVACGSLLDGQIGR